jgi:endonuclease/exonuclease/phosphatase family metal-dependent hydrolase
MDGRRVLVASLGVVGALVAGCRASGSVTPMPDAEEPDAAPQPDGNVPDTVITSGPMGIVAPGITLTYEFTSVPPGATFECEVVYIVAGPTGTTSPAPFVDCASPYSITALPGLHTLLVRARDADGDVDPTPASRTYIGQASARVRLMAGNLTSGNLQAYEDPGTHIFQGLHPDIAMIQEFNVGDNAPATIRNWVDTTFGTSFEFFREAGAQIPNGIVSRYPIRASGIWEDTQSPNREFAYARIDLPGSLDLWAISVHLLTDDTKRPTEATELVGFINANVPAGDYLVIGGDFNSDTRTQAAIMTLGQVVDIGAPFPADQGGDSDTNSTRAKPYDWVMLDSSLNSRQVPVTIGAASFANGLVFDSRVYTPLADVSPVLIDDSGAVNMQHMGVVKDVLLPL